jgi:hypothetical protein
MYVKTLSHKNIVKHHQNLVNNRQKPWSTIIKIHGQKSSKTIVTNHQKAWSTIVKNMVSIYEKGHVQI